MKTILKTVIVITLIVFLSACSSLSSLPEIASEADSEPTDSTPHAQANEQGDDEAGYDGETDLIDPGCHMDEVVLEVRYDHLWTWSPDGTENTGAYVGTAKGTNNFFLNNDGYGNLASDTRTFSFSQEGIIHGDSGKCSVKGSGEAEMTIYGSCKSGVIALEWIEIATEKSEATMVCDGKESSFITFYPLQFEMVFTLPDDGLGYKTSDSTDMFFFRNISMEWTIRYLP